MRNFSFKAFCKLNLQKVEGKKRPNVESICFRLEVSEELDQKAYVNEDGSLTEAGTKAMTQVLTQSIIGNIHAAHLKGIRDSAEHLRYVIAELERGFIENFDVAQVKSEI